MPRMRLETRLPDRAVLELPRIEFTRVEDQFCAAFKSGGERQQAKIEANDHIELPAFERGGAPAHGGRPLRCTRPADAMIEPQPGGVANIVQCTVSAGNGIGAQIDKFDVPVVRRRQGGHRHAE